MTLSEVITSQVITRTILKLKKINNNTLTLKIEELLLIAAFKKAHSCMTPPLLRLTQDKIKNLTTHTISIMMISLRQSKQDKIQITLKFSK
jgi:hypothetical protein